MKKKAYTYWATDNSFYQFEKSKLQETLSLEDWISMNASLDLVRIDSKCAQIYESRKLRFGNYKLYEMRNLSPVRTNSIRYLMNETKDVLLVLEMSNDPIYQLWENLVKAFPENKKLLLHPNPAKRTEEILFDYIKFFFGNVAGKHGPFHIVETLDDIRNRANNHYSLNPGEEPEPTYTAQDWEIALLKCTKLYKHHDVLEIKDPEQPDSDEIKEYSLQNVLMVFKASLFRATIHIYTDTENYGQVYLSNESLGLLKPDPDKPGEYHISFDSEPLTEDGAENLFPEFP